jgi:hypothetical protein
MVKSQEFIYYFRHVGKTAGFGVIATDIKKARQEMHKYLWNTAGFKFISKEKLTR